MKTLGILVLTLLIPPTWASDPVPRSIELWRKQAEFFWGLDFKDENNFKKELSAYNARIYAGELRTNILDWIKEGSLESEYFSSRYSDLKDMKIGIVRRTAKNKYATKTVQSSCYSLEYNPPDILTIVKDFKVTNYSQEQVNHWRSSVYHPTFPGLPRVNADVCLKIHRNIFLNTNPSDGLIVGEKWEIMSSELKLKPEKVPQLPSK